MSYENPTSADFADAPIALHELLDQSGKDVLELGKEFMFAKDIGTMVDLLNLHRAATEERILMAYLLGRDTGNAVA